MAHTEVIANAIENVAYRLAEKNKGMIAPAHLLPYLPVSLELIAEILHEAATESGAITSERIDGILYFKFHTQQKGLTDETSLRVTHCVSCDQDVLIGKGAILCETCTRELETVLEAEAQKSGWPAQAIYEHDICYLAAQIKSPLSAEKLASRSRFTVRRMRRKLTLMKEAGFITENGNQYRFPAAKYPRERYQQNIQFIRTLPASITEDIEVRVVHILIALGIQFLLMFGLAIWAIPFPLLISGFLISAPVTALVIWKRRSKIDSKEVE